MDGSVAAVAWAWTLSYEVVRVESLAPLEPGQAQLRNGRVLHEPNRPVARGRIDVDGVEEWSGR